ncbi:MAG TPA: hypothetical protein VLG38_04125 [Gammaproteobacteria bacterium]|nr:hypothetical protein [Gammaproteobacteria bacterium]
METNDFGKQIRDLLNATVTTVQNSNDETLIKSILQHSKNLFFIIDQDKSVDYKVAIIAEYLECISASMPNSNAAQLMQTVMAIRDKSTQQKFVDESMAAIVQFFDPNDVSPALIAFWLQRSSTMQELKKMDALMMFLTKDQQAKVLAYDKQFLLDPRLQLLQKCLL